MEFEDRITKKCNLEFNDSISTYDGWGAQQNYNAFEVFFNFIGDIKPKRILEIGTSIGGFTCFLKHSCNVHEIDCDVRTYDINLVGWMDSILKMGIDARVENIFLNNYTEIPDEVIEYIQSEGTTVILCDGGNKKLEFDILSNYLKPGDFIFGHDYSYDREKFENEIYQKIWNWHELSESDISVPCDRNNLKDYQRDVFESVVWASKRKAYE